MYTWPCRVPHKKRRNVRRPRKLNDFHMRGGDTYAHVKFLALAVTHFHPICVKIYGNGENGKKKPKNKENERYFDVEYQKKGCIGLLLSRSPLVCACTYMK